jgi:pimeloyl-ACP methyl ester carboxylesterase
MVLLMKKSINGMKLKMQEVMSGSKWKGQFVTIQGNRIHYMMKGEGKPLLLVHGLGAYSYTWRHNIDELARYFRVYALDLKGFGLSDKPNAIGYSIDHHAKMVVQFLDLMNLAQVDYLGSSMGGEIGLRLSLYFPNRINRLVLIASSGYRDSLPMIAKIVRRLPYIGIVKRYVHNKVLTEESLTAIVKGAYYNPTIISEEEIYHYLYPVFLTGFEGAYMRLLKEFDFGKEKMHYSKVKHRTLLIAGEQDGVIPLEHSQRFHNDIKNSILITIGQCGHFLHEEKSKLVNRHLLRFLLDIP